MFKLILLLLFTGHIGARAGLPPYGPGTDWYRFSILTPAGPASVTQETYRKLNRLIYGSHQVQPGESAWSIASLYGTDMESIQSTNGEELILIHPQNTITVQNQKGTLHKVLENRERNGGETLSEITQRYQKDPKALQALKEKIIQANQLPGVALLTDIELPPDQRLIIPGTYLEFDTYRFPFNSGRVSRVSSRFGPRWHPLLNYLRFHEGWDLAQPYGTPVYPSRSGRVVFAGWKGGYGRLIILRHTDGASTRYGHLSKIYAKTGQWVRRGKTLIGKVGSSGLTTGPHLHFEVRDRNDHPINPARKIGRR